MDISYVTNKGNFDYKKNDDFHCFFLSNSSNALANFAIKGIFDKTQGYNIFISDTKEEFKIIDEIVLEGVEEFVKVEILQNTVKRVFIKDGVDYYDSFSLGKNGVLHYFTNYYGNIYLDLDVRRRDQFDKFGRFFELIEQRKDYSIFKYELRGKKSFVMYVGVHHQDLSVFELNNWILKNYTYTKLRNSTSDVYVYRSLRIEGGNKSLRFFASFDYDDVVEKINSNIDEGFVEKRQDLEDLENFKILLPEIHHLTYSQAKRSFNMLRRYDEYLAGGLWFSDVWLRDELVSLSANFNENSRNDVKKLLLKVLRLINKDTGKLPRIEKEGSLESFDGVFWLSKRIFDYSKLFTFEQFSKEEQEEIFSTLYMSFEKIFNNNWDYDTNTLNVINGDSWMDTIELKNPMDMHVQLVGFISHLVQFSRILEKRDEEQHLGVLESFLSEIIKEHFLKDGILSDELDGDDFSCNIFLAYYFYKDLFSAYQWEEIFDRVLVDLQTNWGGIASVGKDYPGFQLYYTGENNLSYHRGDVWYWITSLAGVVLNDLNREKYHNEITQILDCVTNDILAQGCLGCGSELSSFSNQEPRGNLVQLWSNSMFIELIDDIYKIKR